MRYESRQFSGAGRKAAFVGHRRPRSTESHTQKKPVQARASLNALQYMKTCIPLDDPVLLRDERPKPGWRPILPFPSGQSFSMFDYRKFRPICSICGELTINGVELSESSRRAYNRLQVAGVPKGLRCCVKRRFEAEAVSSTCAASVRRTRPACMRSDG